MYVRLWPRLDPETSLYPPCISTTESRPAPPVVLESGMFFWLFFFLCVVLLVQFKVRVIGLDWIYIKKEGVLFVHFRRLVL